MLFKLKQFVFSIFNKFFLILFEYINPKGAPLKRTQYINE